MEDTFILHKWHFPGDSILTVDSIKYVDGNKVLFLSKCGYGIFLSAECLSFIEGIGPNAGIIFQSYQSDIYFADGSLLLCSYKDNVHAYSNISPYFSGQCYVEYGGMEEKESEEIELKVFPNPADGLVRIDYKGSFPCTVEIWDDTGKLISSMTAIDRSPFNLDMTGYPRGMYLIKVVGRDAKYAAGGVIKL